MIRSTPVKEFDMTPEIAHLNSIHKWAAAQPLEKWQMGAVPFPLDGLVAVKMSSGKILTGRAEAFRSEKYLGLLTSTPQYGSIVAYLPVGD